MSLDVFLDLRVIVFFVASRTKNLEIILMIRL